MVTRAFREQQYKDEDEKAALKKKSDYGDGLAQFLLLMGSACLVAWLLLLHFY
jgi:hypothetical protein